MFTSRVTDDDLDKVDDLLDIMVIQYTSTLAVYSDRYSTCSQILPVVIMIENKFIFSENDSSFAKILKATVWSDIGKIYKLNEYSNNGGTGWG